MSPFQASLRFDVGTRLRRCLAHLRSLEGENLRYTMMKMDLLARRKQLDEALALAKKGLAEASEKDRVQFQFALVQLHLAMNSVQQAEEQLLELQKAQPENAQCSGRYRVKPPEPRAAKPPHPAYMPRLASRPKLA